MCLKWARDQPDAAKSTSYTKADHLSILKNSDALNAIDAVVKLTE